MDLYRTPSEEISDLKIQVQALSETIDYLTRKLELSERKLSQIFNSPAWKLSKPLRLINIPFWFVQELTSKHKNNRKNLSDQNLEHVPVTQFVDAKLILENAKANSKKVAYVAHWSDSGTVNENILKLLTSLASNNFAVFLISACETLDPLGFPQEIAGSVTCLTKGNFGYDFGSWAIGLNRFPPGDSTREILLINDSIIGPLTPFDSFLEKLSSSQFDVTSATDTLLHRYHAQSYLIHLKNGSFRNRHFIDFFENVLHLETKDEVIEKYEIGFTATMQWANFKVGALFPWNSLQTAIGNPSVEKWRDLYNAGFPFIKREVVDVLPHSELERFGISKESILR